MALAAVSLLGSVGCVVDSDCGPVTVAEMTWPTAAFAANVEHIVLQHGYGCLSEIVPGNTVPTLTAMVERGEPDVAPEVWLNSIRLVVERGLAEGRLRARPEISCPVSEADGLWECPIWRFGEGWRANRYAEP